MQNKLLEKILFTTTWFQPICRRPEARAKRVQLEAAKSLAPLLPTKRATLRKSPPAVKKLFAKYAGGWEFMAAKAAKAFELFYPYEGGVEYDSCRAAPVLLW